MANQPIFFLFAAIIGSVTTLMGSFLSHWLTTQREQKQWERQQQADQLKQQAIRKKDAYTKTLRCILRARNKNLSTIAETLLYPSLTHSTEWLDDLTESQLALNELVALTEGQSKGDLKNGLELLQDRTNQLTKQLLHHLRSVPDERIISSELINEEIGPILSDLDRIYQWIIRAQHNDMD